MTGWLGLRLRQSAWLLLGAWVVGTVKVTGGFPALEAAVEWADSLRIAGVCVTELSSVGRGFAMEGKVGSSEDKISRWTAGNELSKIEGAFGMVPNAGSSTEAGGVYGAPGGTLGNVLNANCPPGSVPKSSCN